MGVGVPEGIVKEGVCESCELGKHKRQSFPRLVTRRVKKPLEVVHTDVLGPVDVRTLRGSRYAVMFTDERTQWREVYLMATKGEVADKFKLYVERMKVLAPGVQMRESVTRVWELQTGGHVRELRSDNGGEFLSKQLQAYCKEHKIRQTFGGAHAPEQNGIAERSWRTAMEMARCLRLHAGMPKELWGEALSTAVYLLNRLPCTALEGDTPYHALMGRHADLSHARVGV